MDENRLTISAIVSRVCLFLILCRCPKGDKTFVFLRISINSKNPLCTFQQKRLCYSLFQIRMVTCSIKYYSKQLAFQKLNRVALRRRRVCSEKVKKKVYSKFYYVYRINQHHNLKLYSNITFQNKDLDQSYTFSNETPYIWSQIMMSFSVVTNESYTKWFIVSDFG